MSRSPKPPAKAASKTRKGAVPSVEAAAQTLERALDPLTSVIKRATQKRAVDPAATPTKPVKGTNTLTKKAIGRTKLQKLQRGEQSGPCERKAGLVARVDGHGMLAPIRVAEMKRFADGVRKRVEAFSTVTGQADRFGFRPGRVLAEVRFIQD